MGGKSDIIRYASEIPSVLAWDPTYTTIEFETANRTAFSTNPVTDSQNFAKAQIRPVLVRT
jgi:hypothetical protein